MDTTSLHTTNVFDHENIYGHLGEVESSSTSSPTVLPTTKNLKRFVHPRKCTALENYIDPLPPSVMESHRQQYKQFAIDDRINQTILAVGIKRSLVTRLLHINEVLLRVAIQRSLHTVPSGTSFFNDLSNASLYVTCFILASAVLFGSIIFPILFPFSQNEICEGPILSQTHQTAESITVTTAAIDTPSIPINFRQGARARVGSKVGWSHGNPMDGTVLKVTERWLPQKGLELQ